MDLHLEAAPGRVTRPAPFVTSTPPYDFDRDPVISTATLSFRPKGEIFLHTGQHFPVAEYPRSRRAGEMTAARAGSAPGAFFFAGREQAIAQNCFSDPFAGSQHEFMVREADKLRLTLPSPHKGEISKPLLTELLR